MSVRVVGKHPQQTKLKFIQSPPSVVTPAKQQSKVATSSPPVPKVKTPSSATKTGSPATKDRPMPLKTPKERKAEQTAVTPQQGDIRESVRVALCEQLINRIKLTENFELPDEEVSKISVEIESQLYKCFGDTGQKYRAKYRSLMFNIRDVKNQTLWRRICERSLNPYQLVSSYCVCVCFSFFFYLI